MPTLPTGLARTTPGHVAAHEVLHALHGGLPTGLTAAASRQSGGGSRGHLAAHAALKVWYDAAHPGDPLPTVTDAASHTAAHELLHDWANGMRTGTGASALGALLQSASGAFAGAARTGAAASALSAITQAAAGTASGAGGFAHGTDVHGNVGLVVATTNTLAGVTLESAADVTSATGFIGGAGTAGDPYVIDRVRYTDRVTVSSWDTTTLSTKHIKFTNCRFEGDPGSSTPAGSMFVGTNTRPYGPASITIEDSTCGPAAGPSATVGVDHGIHSNVPLTVRRTVVYGAAIAVYLEDPSGSTLIEDIDIQNIWSSAGDHTDGINGNPKASNVTIRRMYLDGIRPGSAYVTNGLGIYNDPGGTQAISNWTLEDSYLTHCASFIISPTATYFTGTWAVTGNIFDVQSGASAFVCRVPSTQSGNVNGSGSPITI